jgi:arabinofuranosyltransferase
VLFLLDAGRRIEQADDAFISYRYALNLVRGHGLVFNPGEYVEGFTNLLWTLLIALFVWLGAQAPSVAQAMSLLFGSLSLVFVHVYVRRFLPRRLAWLAAASPVVLLASNSFACWMTTGL